MEEERTKDNKEKPADTHSEDEGVTATVVVDEGKHEAPAPAPAGGKDKHAKTQEERDAEDLRNFKKVIKAEAHEGDSQASQNLSLKKILGGDILNTSFIRNQIGVFLLITVFLVIYIANRYNVQQNLIKIDKLRNELQDVKYKALSSSSELTEKSRESNVLEQLQNNKDSVLKIPNQPPYIIVVPDE